MSYEHQVLRVRLMGEGDSCYLAARIAKRQWRHIDRLDDGWEFVAFIPKNAEFALFRKQNKEVENGLNGRPYRWARKLGKACA